MTSQSASKPSARLTSPHPPQRVHTGSFSQRPLFSAEVQVASPAPAPAKHIGLAEASQEAVKEQHSQGPEAAAPTSSPGPTLTEPVILAWPFASPPEPLARAIERCVDRLSRSPVDLTRDAGFWQLVSLLCAKQAEEQHMHWPKRFFADTRKGKKGQGTQATATRIQALVEQTRAAYPTLFPEEETLHLSATTLELLILNLENQELLTSELDPLGVAYQQWAGARAREWRAQFFTPLGVAYFLVCLLQPQSQERVLDASCGTGVFFRALHIYRRWYLTALKALCGERGHHLSEEEAQSHLSDYMRQCVYGADVDRTLIRLARLQLAFLHGDSDHVYHMDSLAFPQETAFSAPDTLPFNSLYVLVGNPPYSLPVFDPAILNKYELARVWKRQDERGFQPTDKLQKQVPTELLFLEQALNWLKPGGQLALVLPDSLLSNASTAYARYWSMKRAYVVASISLPPETFKAQSHTGVKTSVLVLRKMTETERAAEAQTPQNYAIYMAVVDHVGYDSRGRTIYTRSLEGETHQQEEKRQVNDELPAVLADFWRFQTSERLSPPPVTLFCPEPSVTTPHA
jgi:type I restriction enzyme M protein